MYHLGFGIIEGEGEGTHGGQLAAAVDGAFDATAPHVDESVAMYAGTVTVGRGALAASKEATVYVTLADVHPGILFHDTQLTAAIDVA